MSSSRPWLALVISVFCLPLFVGLGRADIEHDEAIYSFGVDRLLESGDWLAPKSSPDEDNVFLEKPPLKFWIVAAPIAAGLLPHDEYGIRFWDALFGGLAFVYVFAIGHRLAGPVCGLSAVLVLFVHRPLLFEHGLRTNNMEAPLLLSYCGGVFHYLRWAVSDGARAGREGHAAAAALWFTLGFMTKFVAALFLPLVLGLAGLVHAPVRRRLLGDLALWGAVLAGVVILCAPWFVYAHVRFGPLLWETILQEHVYNRFTDFLDPAHLQPWHYYAVSLRDRLDESSSLGLAALGALLLMVQTIRRRWFEGTTILLWLVLPLGLMSLGTSKLYHYAYPFVPGAALAAGYLAASVATVGALVLNQIVRAAGGLVERRPGLVARLSRPGVRIVLRTVGVSALIVAAVSVAYGPVRIAAGSVEVFRSSGVLRPLVVALLFAVLAGAGRQVAWPVAVLAVASYLPVAAYWDTWTRLAIGASPMRRVTSCLKDLDPRLDEGTRSRGLYVDVPPEHVTHGMYYYFRRLQPWQRTEAPAPSALGRYLEDRAVWRPLLVHDAVYQAYMRGDTGTRTRVSSPPMVALPNVVVLLPGPFSACAADTARTPGR
jgi:4-amino-4-deoxy-L-arabinose transferase-like glycosyltransferase